MSINIRFNNNHKLFQANDEYEFDGDLIIISGINGCGKSQLLNAISNEEKNYITGHTKIDVCHTMIDDCQLKQGEVLARSFRDNISINDISEIDVSFSVYSKQNAYTIYEQICQNPQLPANELPADHFAPDHRRVFNVMWNHIYKTTKKENLYTLTRAEFLRKLPDDFAWRNDDSFTDFIGNWFNLFSCKRHDEMAKCGEEGVKFDAYTFNLNAPWRLLNLLFQKLNFSYRFKDEYEYRTPSLVDMPQLYHVFDDGQVNFAVERKLSELSDGEKTIIMLAVMSLDEKYKGDIKLLVLDEIDATLNPSLIKAFFTVIDEYFIKRGVRVMMTTHSPVTIALAPENATFYEVLPKQNNDESPKIVSIERDEYRELESLKSFYENLLSPNQRQAIKDSKKIIGAHKPPLIFICEDSNKRTMDLWGDLFQKAGIVNVTIISSGGCSTNDLERYMESIKGYAPSVIRQFDRDGMTNEQVAIFCAHFESAFYKSDSRCVKVLPVNEIENFMVVCDTMKFDDEFWKSHSEEIVNSFEKTSIARFRQLKSMFGDTFSKLHNGSGDDITTMQEMRNQAVKEWSSQMPGKDICKKAQNYTPFKGLQELDYDSLPQLLRDFLNEIKQFYAKHTDK